MTAGIVSASEPGARPPVFTIGPDKGRTILVTMTGFWTQADAAAFGDGLRECADKVRKPGAPLCILVDASVGQVQSPPVGAAISAQWPTVMRNPSDRTAVIVHSNLLRAQANRLLAEGSIQMFASEAEARAWLGGGGGGPSY